MQAPTETEGARNPALRRTSDSPLEPPRARPEPAFELKGVVAPLTVLRLRSVDVKVIERQLRIKIAEMPQFFLHAPVLLDLGALGAATIALDFREIASTLRSCHMVPVAITNAAEEVRELAAQAGFGFVAPPTARLGSRAGAAAPPETQDPGPAAEIPPAPAPAARAPVRSHRPPMVIRQPVRSGQIIYAERSDVVVLAPVNPGAEVIADGHVHIYAPLRGRVVAGAQGFADARIFCQRLEAELVAISGAYMLADDIPVGLRGKPAQVYLEDGHCRIAPI